MSVFSLTKGSEHALQLLTLTGGSDTLLLIQPPREVRAEISVQTAAEQKLEAELRLREQRHSMTLQAGDRANAQHLADWVEAVANGTLDTAQAIPQRQPVLLPCCRCEGVAIAYSYLAPAPAQHDLHGVKCRHRDCQSLEGATTAAAAADAWNDTQREELAEAAEPAPAQDEQQPVAWGAFHFGGSRNGKLYTHCETEQQIDSYIADLHRSNDSITLRKGPLSAAPIEQTAPHPEQSGLVEALKVARRELHACQAVIHYAGGFDPAYVRDAQLAIKQIDAALAALATSPAA